MSIVLEKTPCQREGDFLYVRLLYTTLIKEKIHRALRCAQYAIADKLVREYKEFVFCSGRLMMHLP